MHLRQRTRATCPRPQRPLTASYPQRCRLARSKVSWPVVATVWMMGVAACTHEPRDAIPRHAMPSAYSLDRLSDLRGTSGPGTTRDCGAGVRLRSLLVNPAAQPDRVGEWVELVNTDCVSVPTGGLVLEIDAGRRTRRVYLPRGHVMAPGDRLRVGPQQAATTRNLRLRNRGGAVTLRDACGWQLDHVSWQRAEPGERIRPVESVAVVASP